MTARNHPIGDGKTTNLLHGIDTGAALPVRYLAAIFAVSVFVRLANLATIGDVGANALVDDALLYWNGAKYWLDSGFFAVPGATEYIAQTERVPVYFLFLIPFRWLFGATVVPALIAQSLVDAGTCVVLAMIGGMIGRRTGIVTGLLSAGWVNLIIHSSLVLSDTLFVFLISIVLLFAAKFVHRGRLVDAGLAGAFCGLAIMTRTAALFLPVAMAMAAPLIVRYRGANWQRGIGAALIVLILAALPASPIVYRNVTQFGTVQLTDQKSTFMLYWIVGVTKSLVSGRSFDSETKELNTKLAKRFETLEISRNDLNAFEYSEHVMALAFEELETVRVGSLLYAWGYGAVQNLAAPALALEPRIRALNKSSFYNARGDGMIERARSFLVGNDTAYVVWFAIGAFGSAVTLALQAFGGILLFRRLFWPAVFGSLLILYFLLINGPVGGPKYRLPFEPVLIIFQAVAIVELASLLSRSGFWRKSKTAR